MLYLRTGANGSCKSLFTLKDVRDKQLKELRPVCVIVGDATDPARQYVKIKPSVMQEFGWATCRFEDWQAQPDGTIFLADECHNYLPRRPNGSAVPVPVSKLAEHRARGMDFFLLTQHPSNIDTFVTKLIGAPGWHQHLKRVAGGSSVTSVIQWDAVNLQCEKNGAGKSGQVTMRGQPKDVYAWYDSAELHTGKTRIPRAAIFLAVSIILVPALLGGAGYVLWHRTAGKVPAKDQPANMVQGPIGTQLGRSNGDKAAPKTTAEYIASYRPRLPNIRHTAAVYDKLTEPSRVPVPAACVSMAGACKCYTQDATPYTIDAKVCHQLVAGGLWLDFDPDPQKHKADAVKPVQSTQDASKTTQEPARTAQATPGEASQAPSGLIIMERLQAPSASSSGAVETSARQATVPKTSPWSFSTATGS
ncbi:MAG: zonular occludens toxin domain-containing protein [Pseudomonas sp.]